MSVSDTAFAVRDSREPGHFWADNEVLDIYGAQLGAHGIAVYMALCRRANNATGEVRCSTRKLAALVGMSLGGVSNALALINTLQLAALVEPSSSNKPTVYLLANIKTRLRSSGEHLRSSGEHSVHPVNAHKGRQDFLSRLKSSTPLPPPAEGERKIPSRARDFAKIRVLVRSLATSGMKGRPRQEVIAAACEQLGYVAEGINGRLMFTVGDCPFHPDSGANDRGNCWDCYEEG